MEAKNINDSCIFDLQWPGMLLQSAAIVAKKLWVDDKITALFCQRNMSLGCCMQSFK